MTDMAPKYLYDMLKAIQLIEQFIQPIINYNDYLKDFKTRSAVERQLGIIGEAVNKYDALFPNQSIEHARKIVGMRNRLIHAYDSVDSSIIWAIVKNHLPQLKVEIENLINQI